MHVLPYGMHDMACMPGHGCFSLPAQVPWACIGLPAPLIACPLQVEKFLCLGDDRHIQQVWVQGKPVEC